MLLLGVHNLQRCSIWTEEPFKPHKEFFLFFKELKSLIWRASNETSWALHLQKVNIYCHKILILCDSLTLYYCYIFAVIVRRDATSPFTPEYVVTLIHWVFEISPHTMQRWSVGWSLGTFIGQVCVFQYLSCTDAVWLMSWACRLFVRSFLDLPLSCWSYTFLLKFRVDRRLTMDVSNPTLSLTHTHTHTHLLNKPGLPHTQS